MSTATLTWTPPVNRTDGTPISPDAIALTDIFDSTSATPDVTQHPIPVATVAGAVATFTTDVLTVGIHNFTVIVQDTTGHRSAASNTASVDVPAVLANPAAVADLAAVLNP